MDSNKTISPQLDHYTIFCGIFLYTEFKESPGQYGRWNERLSSPDQLFSYLRKTYHENYFNNILLDDPVQKFGNINTILRHETRLDLIQSPLVIEIKAYPELRFQIIYLDRYLFSDGIGIYSFKVQLQNKADASYPVIASLIRLLRNPDCEITYLGKTTKLNQLVFEFLSPGLVLPPNWTKHVVTLKHYTIVNDMGTGGFGSENERILFELAHAMAIGTVSVKNTESPSAEYYQKVLQEASIGVYQNWNALALLDSFTRLSTQFADTYQSWELDYFHIYIYCLYCKYQLHHFNDQWKLASLSKKRASVLKDKFVAFISDHSAPAISNKFLPNLLFEKMKASLEIQQELDTMEKKMGRITEVAESKARAVKKNTPLKGSVIVPGYQYDIFISYRPTDNQRGWVTEFVEHLQHELASTIKDPVSVFFESEREDETIDPTKAVESLADKLNCLIFIPVISHTYCDSKSSTWRHELSPFHKMAKASAFGLDVKLGNGNVSSRILPVCIHELEEEDRNLFARETGMDLRSVDFIYREPGVNRPLKPEDDPKLNLNKTSYHNQVNKIANAVKEVVKGMKKMSKLVS